MNEYRKITFAELQELANKIKYWNEIPVEEICDGAIRFYGDKVSKLKLEITDEYNDQGYDLRVTNIIATDEQGNEIKLPESDDTFMEKYYTWRFYLEIGGESNDGDRTMGEVIVDVKNKQLLIDENLNINELYIKIK